MKTETKIESVQAHRFHDVVGAWMIGGQTVYLSPSQARAFGQALINLANDTDHVSYLDSTIETFLGDSLTLL